MRWNFCYSNCFCHLTPSRSFAQAILKTGCALSATAWPPTAPPARPCLPRWPGCRGCCRHDAYRKAPSTPPHQKLRVCRKAIRSHEEGGGREKPGAALPLQVLGACCGARPAEKLRHLHPPGRKKNVLCFLSGWVERHGNQLIRASVHANLLALAASAAPFDA